MSLTKEQAVAMYNSAWWIGMSPRQIAVFQLHEPLLCMPFAQFHRAVAEALGRDVYTHEFGLNMDGLRAELMAGQPAPTLEEIIDMIPSDKRYIIAPRKP